jgi:hypothetical protein
MLIFNNADRTCHLTDLEAINKNYEVLVCDGLTVISKVNI